MVISQGLLIASVFHKRYSPKDNVFSYKIYYLSVFLRELMDLGAFRLFCNNRFNLFSLYEKDYGFSDFKPFQGALQELINKQEHPFKIKDVLLITLPRVLGYAFNPISFWFCFDAGQNLRAVLCEVNNTFGERHGYLCMENKGGVILKDNFIKSQKVFHVSPFYSLNGEYKFRFQIEGSSVGIWIDYYLDGKKNLSTSLIGKRKALSDRSLLLAFFRYPLITLKVIFLIHYQALKLLAKRIKYIKKPPPPEEEITK
jgi:DUF1365 family protein